ncbi:MAG TPA: glycosyltransferase family 39 protein [Anaerolineae bacterium]|nr:glycosyltransferase family 39 protein [Anaerolineae bacterium]
MRQITRWRGSLSWSVWSALALALAIRLWFAWQPLPTLITRYNADDMYYYLTIARQILAGNGISFDGLAPTNGFHPLYLLLLVGLDALNPKGTQTNIYVALTILCIANVATALVLYELVRRVTRRDTAFLAALVWLFNPFVILATLEGVETALATLFFASTVLAYLVYQWETNARARQHRVILVGVLAGLLLLARMDGILLVFALGADWLWRAARKWKSTNARGLLLEGCYGAAVCGALLLPWVAWNLVTFGTPNQVSGTAIAYTAHLGQTTLSASTSAIWNSINSLLSWVLVVNFQIVLLVLITGISWAVLRSRHKTNSFTVPSPRGLWVLALYTLLWLAFYGVYFLHRQLWYLQPMMLVGTIVGVLLWERAVALSATTVRAQRIWLISSCGLVFITFLGWWVTWDAFGLALHPAQADGYRVALWLKDHTPPDARVGAWNSGIIAYFSERTVINLDGVVNNTLTRRVIAEGGTFALQDIWHQVRADDITFITDYEQDVWQNTTPIVQSSLKPVHQFASTVDPRFQVTLYQVLP